MNAILALDQGTTSSRAIVFDLHGKSLGTAQQEFRQIFPKPAWVEHDAREIWQSQREVAAAALRIAQDQGATIAAIGITNQRETTVLWDRSTGEPVANAIVWQDRRTAPICESLFSDGHGERFRQKTGLVLDAYFSGTKLKWLLDQIPGARERAGRGELAFGTVDSWLIFKLTGGKVHATDVSNASRTLLCNIHTADWDDELLDILDIPRSVLPQIVSSSGIIGLTACEGLPPGIPIAGVAGDQQAALFGQACHQSGMIKNTYGTGCFMLMNTGQQAVTSANKLLTTIAWRLEDDLRPTYALEGSVFIGGAAIQWLRDGLGVISSASEVESLAASVPDSDGIVFVPAFAGLGAPHWDPYARGAILGLTRGTTKAHLARAALESIALQSADLADAMAKDASVPVTNIRVDGGASVNSLLMQMQADIARVTVTRPVVSETTALGAAFLAGLGFGVWSGIEEISKLWAKDRDFLPSQNVTAVEKFRARWIEGVRRASEWSNR